MSNRWAVLMRYVGTTYGYFPPGLVDMFSCRLVLCGSAPHRGESKSAVLDIDLSSGRVSMALLGDGQNTICQDKYPATIAAYANAPRGCLSLGGRAI